MADVSEDIARLLLQFEEQGYEAVRAKVAGLKGQLDTLEKGYNQGTIGVGEYAQAGAALERQIAREQAALDRATASTFFASVALEQLTGQTNATTEAKAKFADVAGKSGFAVGGLNRSIMAGAYAMQDFSDTSGDLGQKLMSISNNLPMLLAPLGGFGMALSLAGTAAIALYRNWDQAQALLGLGIPRPILDGAAELEAALKKDTKEFEELGKKTQMSLAELGRYRDLSNKIADEKRQQEDAKQVERLKGLKGQDEQERISGFQKAIAESGGYDQVIADVTDAIYNEANAKGIERTLADIQAEAKKLVLEGSRGDAGAASRIRGAVGGFLPGSPTAANIFKFSPEGKLTDALNKQGQEGEEDARKELARSNRERAEYEAAAEHEANAAVAALLAEQGKGAAKAKKLTAKERAVGEAFDSESNAAVAAMLAAERKSAPKQQQRMLAEDMFNKSQGLLGGQISPDQAMAAAHKALQAVSHGANLNDAALSAMVEVATVGARLEAKMIHQEQQFNMLRRQVQAQSAQAQRTNPF